LSARAQQPPGAVKFPGSKLSVVAIAAVLLGGATAWIGARDERTAAAPADAPQQLGPNGGNTRAGNARAVSPRPATRTRAS